MKLNPLLDENDRIIEPFEEYYMRFNRVHSHIPREVVEQWFYEHPKAYDENTWLDYDKLSFGKYILHKDELNESDFENTAIDTYFKNYMNGIMSSRLEGILEHFKKYGTWPIPIILLRNPDPTILKYYGIEKALSWLILEGHNRLTAFFISRKENIINEEHEIWAVTRTTA